MYKCVYLGDRDDYSPRYYACKVFKRSKMNQRMLKNLHEESISLRKLSKHPNIINSLASFKTKRNFYLVVEYCNAGDLESLMESGLYLSEKHVRFIFKGKKESSFN